MGVCCCAQEGEHSSEVLHHKFGSSSVQESDAGIDVGKARRGINRISDTPDLEEKQSVNLKKDKDKYLKKLIKLQALILGFLVRNRLTKKNELKDKKSQISNSFISHSLNKSGGGRIVSEKVIAVDDPEFKPYTFKDNKRRHFNKIEIDMGTKSYEGEWLNGKRDGFGVLNWKDGNVFKGYFINDMSNGLGRQHHKTGEIYFGQWVNDRAEGWGEFINKAGSTYRGEWKGDKQHGFGIEEWSKGAVYKGEFLNGQRNGKGILRLEDGSQYEGEFKNNEIDGVGIFNYFDGKQYSGEWKRNQMSGFGILVYSQTKMFEGCFKADMKHGFGVYINNGKIYIGNWIENKLEGEACVIDVEKNEIKNSSWKEGKKISYLTNESIYKQLASNFLKHK